MIGPDDTSGVSLALHACCGPCLLEPYDALAAEAHRAVVVFFNPNIHPAHEYEQRKATLMAYARDAGIEVVELDYDVNRWHEQVGVHGDNREQRCSACYRLRLGEVARWAADNGFSAVSTTLSVSPYQDAQKIAAAGHEAAREAGVVFIERDFTERYPEATRRSRELGMYRQNYCGCGFSDVEARHERAERKARRAAEKAARNG